jgi:hypothetical protein
VVGKALEVARRLVQLGLAHLGHQEAADRLSLVSALACSALTNLTSWVTAFGVVALTFMMVMYSLERRQTGLGGSHLIAHLGGRGVAR